MLYATKDEAKRASRAALHDLKRGKGDFEVEGPGMPDVFAEATATIKGFDPDVDGSYRVRTVRHTYEGRGFTTTVTMELAGEVTDDETDEDTGASP
jgi:phage protein D